MVSYAALGALEFYEIKIFMLHENLINRSVHYKYFSTNHSTVMMTWYVSALAVIRIRTMAIVSNNRGK